MTLSRRFALICYRDTGKPSVEVTYWPSNDDARQALAELAPCGPRCNGVHIVADIDPPHRHPAALALPRNRHEDKAPEVGIGEPGQSVRAPYFASVAHSRNRTGRTP